MEPFEQTPRTKLKRLPDRGAFDRDTVHAILDEALICHVGFVHEGAPVVIPTLHGRAGDMLYVHGSAASRMLKTLGDGVPVCITVSIVDGLVLARSAFHHSINYRSVVVFGRATVLEDPDEKNEALRVVSEHVVPGRWEDVRPPAPIELKQTTVLAVALNECSAKIRTGGPKDDEDDYRLPVWAGVLPISLQPAAPIPDAVLPPATPVPEYLKRYSRPPKP
jgi:nitroimidazol reductase NimA-like FMN-containing flavoprotein (pyridoxamine 5'-phosphate oxidase superfamily)